MREPVSLHSRMLRLRKLTTSSDTTLRVKDEKELIRIFISKLKSRIIKISSIYLQ